jgi:hypothetical protein
MGEKDWFVIWVYFVTAVLFAYRVACLIQDCGL